MVKQWGTGLALAAAAWLINQNAFLQAVEGPGLEGGAPGAQNTASQETIIPRCPPAHIHSSEREHLLQCCTPGTSLACPPGPGLEVPFHNVTAVTRTTQQVLRMPWAQHWALHFHDYQSS